MNFPFPLRVSQVRISCYFLGRKELSVKSALLGMAPGFQGDNSSEEVQTPSYLAFGTEPGTSECADL